MDIPWIRDAYKMHQYAFVADYVRLYALYKRGGIYLDTDMLLIHSLDVFLNEQKFIGREDKYYASFGIIAMPPGDEFCKLCLEYYDNSVFDAKHRITINAIITAITFFIFSLPSLLYLLPLFITYLHMFYSFILYHIFTSNYKPYMWKIVVNF